MTAPGGYRQPSNPAPVSGPGALARRTDGGPEQPVRDLPDAKYGENRDFVAQQEGAPLPTQAAPPALPVEAAAPRPPVMGLNQPSARPDEPVTAGSPFGAGPGPRRPGINAEPGSVTAALEPYFAADPTGVIANLAWSLSERGL